MAKEIERKFLVKLERLGLLHAGLRIKQGYISTNPVVRIRVCGDTACLTVKGITSGIMRDEYEYSIPVNDANEMLDNLCEKLFIEKTRYESIHGGIKWEIDVFGGDNKGLVVAEVEFDFVNESGILPPSVEIPPWVGKDVSSDPRYFNVNLVKHPFKDWSE